MNDPVNRLRLEVSDRGWKGREGLGESEVIEGDLGGGCGVPPRLFPLLSLLFSFFPFSLRPILD